MSQSAVLKTSQTGSRSGQTGSGSGQTSSGSGQSGPSAEAKDKARRLTVATGAATAFFGASYILYLQLRAEDQVSILSSIL